MNELIFKAAQYMDEHGKTTGAYERGDGSVCMVGALRRVIGTEIRTTNDGMTYEARPWIYGETYNHLTKFAASAGHKRPIEEVNDIVLRTKEETVKFMMEAAEWEPTS